ncbi:MAG: YhbY family RNA-binding protein [Gemmatimonadota bacterium]|jgi:RNA-binding protein|nr:YhbY family RNA-binding protein [Gemmatimonadota bacterium]MDP6528761.1 YhbY family RNA-binding protein [Gemmatimonadota bacterium]MDP6803182.1 YhbY family RNA-binding protein [Gemmatimonadota bacterium]MDP7031280.1 YhbY family RNA-binding protein [Gemmatimonadota bacterium]
MELRGKDRRYLRGLGVSLKPAVLVGKASATPGVLAQIQDALEAHELVKIRLLESVEGNRKIVSAELAAAAEAELVQVLGRTALLYRPRAEKPVIELPQ